MIITTLRRGYLLSRAMLDLSAILVVSSASPQRAIRGVSFSRSQLRHRHDTTGQVHLVISFRTLQIIRMDKGNVLMAENESVVEV